MDEFNPDEWDSRFDPEQWEVLTDHFLLVIRSLIDEGYELHQIMAALSFSIADLGQQILDEKNGPQPD